MAVSKSSFLLPPVASGHFHEIVDVQCTLYINSIKALDLPQMPKSFREWSVWKWPFCFYWGSVPCLWELPVASLKESLFSSLRHLLCNNFTSLSVYRIIFPWMSHKSQWSHLTSSNSDSIPHRTHFCKFSLTFVYFVFSVNTQQPKVWPSIRIRWNIF